MADTLPILTLPDQKPLRLQLLAWFANIKRDLPWRASDDLYGVWISEIMLQQTTVAAVVPFWQNFMRRFPTVAALASAEEAEVLTAWSGLGYYTRARNLHRAARKICDELDGVLPNTRDQWLSMPGVGPYAAGAIASIGLNERVPAMDANARRVIQRWATQDPAALAALTPAARQRLVDDLGAELVPFNEAAAWNESLMELGALVCRAKKAACDECPVVGHCAAYEGDWINKVPPPKTSQKAQPVWLGLLVISWRDRVLLQLPKTPPRSVIFANRTIVREDFSGLHHGLWSLPGTAWLEGHETPPPAPHWPLEFDLPGALMERSDSLTCLGEFRHAITKYRLSVSVYHYALDGRAELPDKWWGQSGQREVSSKQGGMFFALDDSAPPISQLTRKAWQLQRDAFS